MLQATEETVWLTDDTDKLRYLLFQAFRAAEENIELGEPFISYAALRLKFKIRTSARKVIATPRIVSPIEAVRAQLQQKVVVKDAYETPEIIAALGLHKAQEIVFEGAHQEDLNLKGLYEVAKRHGYYMIPATSHITFSKHKEDEILAWTPEEA